MARTGKVGSEISLRRRFYRNGLVFTPNTINDVRILTAPSGSVLDTIAPTEISTGLYAAAWSVPTNIKPGTYYDEWGWKAESSMQTQIRVSSFTIHAETAVPTSTRTGPLFVGQREVNFFHGINKELIQRIVCQKVIYYSVSLEHTNIDDLYGEAVSKTVYTPVEINARILYQEPEQKVDQFSIDTIYKIEVYFYQEELRERQLIPREGDFVKFGDITYEIEKLNRPQITYGQISREVMIKAVCRVARESQINILDDIQGKGEV